MGTRREKLAKWVKSLSAVQKILIGIIVAFVVITILYQFKWSGFAKDENESKTTKKLINPRTGVEIIFTETTTTNQSAKTLWDWLQLGGTIAIPFALLYFERREQRRSEKRAEDEDKRAKDELKQVEQQIKREKEIANSSLREQALEAYIDRISDLLIDKDLGLLIRGFTVEKSVIGILKYDKLKNDSDPESLKRDTVLDIARARTLSVLRCLDGDGERKISVIQFLDETELISYLDFEDADLRDVKNFSPNVILKAKNWKLAKYDEEFRAKLAKYDE
jgi:hypothetical protein